MSKPKSDAVPLYEGMFLLSPAALEGDLSKGLDMVRQLLEKREAEIVALRKWDERRLVYPIKGERRGTYFLALFRMDGKRITPLERECELSEEVLRVMITRADHLGELEIEQAVQAAATTRDEAKLRAAGEDQAPAAEPGAEAGADENAAQSATAEAPANE